MKTVNSIIALLALSWSPAEATVLTAEAAYGGGKSKDPPLDKKFVADDTSKAESRRALSEKCCVANGDFAFHTWLSSSGELDYKRSKYYTYYRWMGLPQNEEEKC